jgi:hypothetical protein
LTYFVVKTGTEFDIIPLNQQAIIDPGTGYKDIVGLGFTSASIVPYFYPGFRMGVLEFDEKWMLKEHQLYSARIGGIEDVVYNEICSSSVSLGMSRVSVDGYKDLLVNVQHELDVQGKSELAREYWECSIVKFGGIQGEKIIQERVVEFIVLGIFVALFIRLFMRRRRIMI